MISYLEFEKPVAAARSAHRRTARRRRRRRGRHFGRTRAARERRAPSLLASDLCRAHPVAEDPGRAPSRCGRISSDYVQLRVRRFRAAGRRPPLRRRPGDHGRARHARRAQGRADRAREGPRHRKPHPAQLRHGQARGLSQGDPPDGAGGALRAAGGDAGRHLGRVSRDRGRRARPGRSDRPLDRGVPGACRCRWSR